jgi:endonuclease-3
MRDSYPKEVLSILRRRYGSDLTTNLNHRNLTHLFVAALLSPQCTDDQVNRTTKELFKKFKTFRDYADADPVVLRRYLKGVNYYKTKARHLRQASRQALDLFGGRVPKTLSELMQMQGVGRKVANVILNEGYGINEGIAVDTHVTVTAKRLGLTRSRDPYAIERDLMRRYPMRDWGSVSNHLIELGRDTCTAREKKCSMCSLRKICPSSDAKVDPSVLPSISHTAK